MIALVTFIELAYRIHVEEHALLEELGERYRTYGEQHKRLVPFVW